MRNILLWAGIAVLAFQDSFKKKPVKPTRQQQFFQTGGTSQAFIEGTRPDIKKILYNFFGKYSYKNRQDFSDKDYVISYFWIFKYIKIQLVHDSTNNESEIVIYTDDDNLIGYIIIEENSNEEIDYNKIGRIVKRMFDYHTHIKPKLPDEYFSLNEIAKSGDWELALQIAKSQDLL